MPLLRLAASVSVLACLTLSFACGGDDNGSRREVDIATDVDPDSLTGDVEVDTTPVDFEVETRDGGETETGECPGCFGAPCEDNSDCNSGWCVPGPADGTGGDSGNVCTSTCEDACPSAWSCRPVGSPGGDVTYICIYDHSAYCAPCDDESDCVDPIAPTADNRCMAAGDGLGSYCATACRDDAECPVGSACELVSDDGEESSVCRPVPTEGDPAPVCDCSPWAINRAASTSCSATNPFGTCDGRRACGDDGLGACNATPAAAETCNRADDDCDGQTDEDFPELGEACDGDDADACELGTLGCGNDGAVVCQNDRTAGTEVCNGRDDDCDGETDEALPDDGMPCDGDDDDVCEDDVVRCVEGSNRCVDAGAPVIEVCNAVDDDCDGFTDRDDADMVLPLCEGAKGVCAAVSAPARLCDAGVWAACDNEAFIANVDYEAAAETRCDGLDNDCDGTTDEDFALALLDGTTVEGVGVACGAGACAGAVTACNGRGDGIACPGEITVATEICNGIDDDCDGRTDAADALPVASCERQVGVCTGALKPPATCVGGAFAICGDAIYEAHAATYESGRELSCDGLDNDCDGFSDEDFTATLASGATVTGVGKPCGVGACAGGFTVCDADGEGASCSSDGNASPEICNGKDDDCDGLTDGLDPDLVRPACEKQGGICAGALKPAALCAAGVWRACGAAEYDAFAPDYEAGAEVKCDGKDEDCDGVVDDDFEMVMIDGASVRGVGTACGSGACAGGTARCAADGVSVECSSMGSVGDEVCDGVDNDCDGDLDAADGSLVRATCNNQVGICAGAKALPERCVNGQWGECVAADFVAHDATYQASVELACDGRDEDCSGSADEDFTMVTTDGATVTGIGKSCGAGECTGGTTVCAAGGLALACDSSGDAAAEVCDGVDNDCDGKTDADDSGLVTITCQNQRGVCGGSMRPADACVGGQWQDCADAVFEAHAASYESGSETQCDGADNDCDGNVDEDFAMTDKSGATINGAGKSCGVGACAGGVTTCTSAKDGIECLGDANASAERCNFIDDDCDGLADAADTSLVLDLCAEQRGSCEGATHARGQCSGGQWTACQAADFTRNDADYQAGLETRCDEEDNDCDGSSDEDITGVMADGTAITGVGQACGGGACEGGVTLCALDGASLRCSAEAGIAQEICDGIDNDCDGATDKEDTGLMRTTCGNQIGVCQGAIRPASLCVDGRWSECGDDVYIANNAAYEPNDELSCDGVDNDCSNSVDEDFAYVQGDSSSVRGVGTSCGLGTCSGTTLVCNDAGTGVECPGAEAAGGETCNGLDDDCDGLTDNDDSDLVIVPCELTTGACTNADKPAELCQGGAWLACTDAVYFAHANTYNSGIESRCDGVDNDCDAATDEDFDLTLLDGSQVSGTGVSCGVGRCSGGLTRCNDDDSAIECSSETSAIAETCNNADDDCDGMVDAADDSMERRVCALQAGVCAGARALPARCVGGNWGECIAADYTARAATYQEGQELSCDDLDNDCSGAKDEDFTWTSPAGTSFTIGQTCGTGRCASGSVVCSGTGAVTCTTANQATAETCNNLDEDCNGIVDNGCDDDGDDYCDIALGTTGTPPVCPNGGGDCDDAVATTYPTAPETCNQVNDDCDGQTDEQFVGCDARSCDGSGDAYASIAADTCTLGQCTTPTSVSCGLYTCDGGGAAGDVCATVCTTDSHCVASAHCDQGICKTDLTNGSACVEDSDCAGNHCQNGFCCDSGDCCQIPAQCPATHTAAPECATTTTCQGTRRDRACVDNMCGKTEPIDDDTACGATILANDCGNYDDLRCTGQVSQSIVCPTSCTNSEQCDDGAFCNASGQCVPKPVAGEACDPEPCAAGLACVDGVCCTSSCAGDCRRCDVTPGQCSNSVGNDPDGDCEGFDCVGSTTYYWGWVGDSCYAKAPVTDAASVCDVDGTCGDRGELCSAQTTRGASQVTCDDTCEDPTPGSCSGTIAGACVDVDAGSISCGVGECRRTVPRCLAGVDNTCVANNPGVEVCNGLDDNCDSVTDEGCDDDNDDYCDTAMAVVGTDPATWPPTCQKGGGDCNDALGATNPGATERCNDVDDDCKNGLDEGCDNDNDDFCDSAMVTVGTNPATWPTTCKQGGGDCADTNDQIKPSAAEACDNIDNNCAAIASLFIDEGCDDDNDDYCDSAMNVVGAPTTCTKGGGDCNDAVTTVFPSATETCDGVDNNCAGLPAIDEGCDDDNDDYCDSAMTRVGTPPTCQAGGNDCRDDVSTINPGVADVCDNTDNDCSGSIDTPFIDGTITYDLDPSGIGLGKGDTCGVGACQGGIVVCDGPAALACSQEGGSEICDGVDNNCDGNIDEGCDDDNDDHCDSSLTLVGTNPATWPPTCQQGGNDCNDGNGDVHPHAPEICDNVDNNCVGSPAIDEGCDDDNDDYCDSAMGIVGTPTTCTLGGGDCNDGNGTIRPNAAEVCDGLDNNCVGAPAIDEGCDDDDDNYCDSAMTIVGTPPTCTQGGGDCNDAVTAVHPNAVEACDNVDNNCAGSPAIDEGCDDDNDNYCDSGMGIVGANPATWPSTCTAGGGDCNDGNGDIRPNAIETCDNVDNNCAGSPAIDEGCDDDNDNYCDSAMTLIGTPETCTAGGGDCNDAVADVRPNAVEVCDNVNNDCDVDGVDEGCDDDNDDYCDSAMTIVGTNPATWPTTCTAGGGDCNDGNGAIKPNAPEVCDNLNNDCDLDGVDEGCDDDNDNYCDSSMSIVGTPTTCTAGGGDCNDDNTAVNPGVAEICDSVDNNCAGTPAIDEGCDDDNDNYCDSAMGIVGTNPATWPATCTAGGGDCVDNNDQIKPGAVEVCDNIDNNCAGAPAVDEGCDDDNDNYCDSAMGIVGTSPATWPTTCAAGGGDCNDGNDAIKPGATEVCDNLNNDCDVDGADEGCDDDNDNYCDSAMGIVGLPTTCSGGGGDCNDGDGAIRPNATETCDNVNNDCDVAGVDEGCDDDDDNYCDSSMVIVGTNPATWPATCTLGGGDCNDGVGAIRPNATEICDNLDNNCAGSPAIDEGCDDDNDDYCDSAMTVTGTNPATWPTTCTAGGGDCNDAVDVVRPNATEICDNIDNNCAGSPAIDEGCDDDGDNYCDSAMTITGTSPATWPATCTAGGGDCNDLVDAIRPNATEVCDNINNDCDIAGVDEGCDDDGDNYCDSTMTLVGTTPGTWPSTCTAGGNDCNDGSTAINPGITEICDRIDNNCLGTPAIDEGCDDDNDDYCDSGMTIVGTNAATWPTTCSLGGGDCNDSVTAIRPGATEICDGLDNNCAGSPAIDEGCDDDNDNYCQSGMTITGSSPATWPPTCTAGGGDCNDANASINPGAADLPDTSVVDSNCDGIDGDETLAAFVSPGGSGAQCTRVAPCSLATGLSGAKAYIYMMSGNYIATTSSWRISRVVSLFGGYNSSWVRSADRSTNPARLQSSGAQFDSQYITLRVSAISGILGDFANPVKLFDLYVDGYNVPVNQFGRSTYAIHAKDTYLELNRCTVTSGNGHAGAAGAAGNDNNTRATAGGDGGEPSESSPNSQTPGGSSATHSCTNGGSRNMTSGAGGYGGSANGSGDAQPGGSGGNASYWFFGGNGAGGAGGSGYTRCCSDGTSDNGTIGNVGAAGTNGSGGSNGGNGYGTKQGDYWVAFTGNAGNLGDNGGGAGGGGGSGGSDEWDDSRGAGGGGGGAGGCRSTNPGGGGAGGGGSFGVFAVNVALTVNSSAFVRGAGGAGGAGGSGGFGQLGGLGGIGGNIPTVQEDNGFGGNGNEGGRGGAAGGGGGGAGGVSFGIFRFNGSLTEDFGNTYTSGVGGTGGAGGARTSTNSGTAGATGALGTVLHCTGANACVP